LSLGGGGGGGGGSPLASVGGCSAARNLLRSQAAARPDSFDPEIWQILSACLLDSTRLPLPTWPHVAPSRLMVIAHHKQGQLLPKLPPIN